MTNEEKAKMIADQCKPCTDDFYNGMYQGVLLTLNVQNEKRDCFYSGWCIDYDIKSDEKCGVCEYWNWTKH